MTKVGKQSSSSSLQRPGYLGTSTAQLSSVRQADTATPSVHTRKGHQHLGHSHPSFVRTLQGEEGPSPICRTFERQTQAPKQAFSQFSNLGAHEKHFQTSPD